MNLRTIMNNQSQTTLCALEDRQIILPSSSNTAIVDVDGDLIITYVHMMKNNKEDKIAMQDNPMSTREESISMILETALLLKTHGCQYQLTEDDLFNFWKVDLLERAFDVEHQRAIVYFVTGYCNVSCEDPDLVYKAPSLMTLAQAFDEIRGLSVPEITSLRQLCGLGFRGDHFRKWKQGADGFTVRHESALIDCIHHKMTPDQAIEEINGLSLDELESVDYHSLSRALLTKFKTRLQSKLSLSSGYYTPSMFQPGVVPTLDESPLQKRLCDKDVEETASSTITAQKKRI